MITDWKGCHSYNISFCLDIMAMSQLRFLFQDSTWWGGSLRCRRAVISFDGHQEGIAPGIRTRGTIVITGRRTPLSCAHQRVLGDNAASSVELMKSCSDGGIHGETKLPHTWSAQGWKSHVENFGALTRLGTLIDWGIKFLCCNLQVLLAF